MGHGVLMAYGLRDGTLLHVTEVERGLACNLTCYFCGDTLVARRGNVRVPHLAHHSLECNWSPESLLHRLAKEIFVPGVTFLQPDARVAVKARDLENRQFVAEEKVLEQDALTVQGVSIERSLEGFRPDVLVVSNDQGQVAIEIAVTHVVDKVKRAKVRRAGVPTVEIRLTPSDAGLPRDEVAKIVLGGSRAEWVFHPKIEAVRSRLRREVAAQIRDRNRRIREQRRRLGRRSVVGQLSQAATSLRPSVQLASGVGASSQSAKRLRPSYQVAYDLWVYNFYKRNNRPPTREEESVYFKRRRN